MNIQTTRFGQINIAEEHIISIPDGILGFPNSRRYVLLEHDSEGTPFKWLQSVDIGSLAFIVMDPNLVASGYEAQLDPESSKYFDAEKVDDRFVMMGIVNVPRENPVEMTINLRAPIVVSLEKRIGRQVVLGNENYQIRHRIFPETQETTIELKKA